MRSLAEVLDTIKSSCNKKAPEERPESDAERAWRFAEAERRAEAEKRERLLKAWK